MLKLVKLTSYYSEVSLHECAAHATSRGAEAFARSADRKGCSFINFALFLLDSAVTDKEVYVRPEAASLLGM